MSETDIQLDMKNLEKLIKSLKRGKLSGVKIGIFGGHQMRNDGPTNNATIGMIHEFGMGGLPQRSFLRIPIKDNLNKRIEASGLFNEKLLKEVIADGTIGVWLKQIGIIAEGIVADGFDSGGFGKWEPSDMTHKKNAQTLVETTQLRNSISTKIDE